MIEVVYSEGAEEKDVQKTIDKPKNIKQIGAGGSRYKIYMEDYVLTCIKRGPKTEDEVKYGLLLGEMKRGEGNIYFFIRGMVEAADQKKEVEWTEEIWNSLYEDINKYFANQTIVGWFVSLPFTNDHVRLELNRIQYSQFPGAEKVLLMMDRGEGEEKFFRHNGAALQEIEGYYIYFDRNDAMREYMGAKGFPPAREKEKSGKRTRHGALGERVKWKHKISAASVMVTAALLTLVILLGGYGDRLKKGSADGQPSGENSGQTEKHTEAAAEAGASVADPEVNNETESGETLKHQEDESENIDGTDPAGDIESVEETESLAWESSRVSARTYTVQKGETLYQICMDVYNSIAMIEVVKELNNIGDDYIIQEGQKIILP